MPAFARSDAPIKPGAHRLADKATFAQKQASEMPVD
jgi:hypothetical protein